MLIGRVRTSDGPVWVRRTVDGMVPISSPFTAFAAGGLPEDVGASVSGPLLAPCEPGALVGIAQNGPSHASPVQAWLKNPRTVVASDVAVTLRRDAGTTVAEGEIAVVIGRDTADLTAATAHEYVLGLTAVNDLSSPDRAAVDPRNFETKAGIGYTPLGPWIDTEGDLDSASLRLLLDGSAVAETDAAALPVPIRECLAYVAHWTPLGPGDVVMTGAPFSNAAVAPGSLMQVDVGGVLLTTPTN